MLRGIFRLFLLLVVVAAVGYYRGWFYTESHRGDGTAGITVTVEKDKIKDDAKAAKDEARNLGDQIKDKVAAAHGQPATQPLQRQSQD